MDEIFMDIPHVREYSAKFERIAERLGELDNGLTSLMESLKEQSFEGKIGTAAVNQYEGTFKPKIQELKEKCEEMSRDLEESAKAYEDEDAQTSTYF